MTLDCQKCRGKRKFAKDCPGKLFYSYNDIFFCQEQMIWLIANIGYLTEGKWPPHPLPASDSAPNPNRQFRHEAYFVKSSVVLAELKRRLHKAGKDGETLVDEIYGAGIKNYELLSRYAKNALNYISGRDLRATPYSSWRAKIKYRGNNNGNAKGFVWALASTDL